MSCNDNNNVYRNSCCPDTPYPNVQHESVPSLIDNLVDALYGEITKTVSGGRVVWDIPCDPAASPAEVPTIPRETGEGLLCYLMRIFQNTVGQYSPFQYWSYTGNGSQTSFALSPSTNTLASSYLVHLNGVVQRPVSQYTISNTNPVNAAFVNPPVNGAIITIVNLGYQPPGVIQDVTQSDATPTNSSQTQTVGAWLAYLLTQLNTKLSAPNPPMSGSWTLGSVNGIPLWQQLPTIPPVPSTAGQFVLATAGNNSPASWQLTPTIAVGPITATGSTTARFLSDRFADIINVKDFGAIGNGVADDAPAIRAALVYANSIGGGAVYFPKGTYRLISFDPATPVGQGIAESMSGFKLSSRGGYHTYSYLLNSDQNNVKKLKLIGDGAVIESPVWSDNIWLGYSIADAGQAGSPNLNWGLKLHLTFTGGGGSGAAGYCRFNGNGQIGDVIMTSAGSGYTSAPTVTLLPTGLNINPEGYTNVYGTGATFTANLSGGGVNSVTINSGGSGYGLFMTMFTFFTFQGYYDIVFSGLEFKQRVGGAGERPLRGDFSGTQVTPSLQYPLGYTFEINGNDYRAYCGAKCIRIEGIGNYAANSFYTGNIVVENCKFINFVIALDITFANELLVTKNYCTAEYGSGSVPRNDMTGFLFTRYGVRKVVATENIFVGCEARDLTSIIASSGGNTGNWQGWMGLDNGVFTTPDGAMESCVIEGNTMIRYGYEGIAVMANSYVPDSINYNISNNILDGKFPDGLRAFRGGGNYGIVTDSCPTVLISGNRINDTSAAILVGGNFGGVQSNSQGVSILNNLISYWTPLNIYLRALVAISTFRTVSQTIPPFNSSQRAIISGNTVYFGLYPNITIEGTIQNWNGNWATWNTDVAARTPVALSLGNSSTITTVLNNTFVVANKQSASTYSLAMSGICEGLVENNNFEGFDFLWASFGGNGNGVFGTRNTCSHHVIRQTADSVPMFRTKEQKYVLYPTQVGWHRISTSGRGVSHYRLEIFTLNKDKYGDSTLGEGNGVLQTTNIDVVTTTQGASVGQHIVNQLSHTNKNGIAVSKYACLPDVVLRHGIYVNKVTEKLALLFSGGGGTGAAGYVNVVNGVIQNPAVITNPGSGYTSAPTVSIDTFLDGVAMPTMQLRGSGAAFTASIGSGQVTSVAVTSGGSGYAQPIYITYIDYFYDSSYAFNSSPLMYIERDTVTNYADPAFLTLIPTAGSQTLLKSTDAPYKTYGYAVPTSGTVDPTTAPQFLGQIYINSAANIIYMATGNAAVSDWNAVSTWTP